jgi:UTP-glucose-1-phosphate uridylyltransferase
MRKDILASLSNSTWHLHGWNVSVFALVVSDRLAQSSTCTDISNMYHGYASSVIGSIAVNQGSIDQFGTVKDPKTGALAVNSEHISLWALCTL